MQTIDYTPLGRPADRALRDQVRAEARAGEWGSAARRMARGLLKGLYWKDFARLRAFASANGFVARPVDDADDLKEGALRGLASANWRVLGVWRGRRFQICQLEFFDLPPATFVEVLSAVPLPELPAMSLQMDPSNPRRGGALGTDELRTALAEAKMGFWTTSSAMCAQAAGGSAGDAALWRRRLAVVDAMAGALERWEATRSQG